MQYVPPGSAPAWSALAPAGVSVFVVETGMPLGYAAGGSPVAVPNPMYMAPPAQPPPPEVLVSMPVAGGLTKASVTPDGAVSRQQFSAWLRERSLGDAESALKGAGVECAGDLLYLKESDIRTLAITPVARNRLLTIIAAPNASS
jgi:hypothetical protein